MLVIPAKTVGFGFLIPLEKEAVGIYFDQKRQSKLATFSFSIMKKKIGKRSSRAD